uniref:Uncharacterized protein n=1 Tax=Cercocebus atys TaxID=9531 RepID=A0A2K5N7C2_CERAT
MGEELSGLLRGQLCIQGIERQLSFFSSLIPTLIGFSLPWLKLRPLEVKQQLISAMGSTWPPEALDATCVKAELAQWVMQLENQSSRALDLSPSVTNERLAFAYLTVRVSREAHSMHRVL